MRLPFCDLGLCFSCAIQVFALTLELGTCEGTIDTTANA
jgi:hypothetical protein